LVPGQRTLVLTSEGVVLASRGTPDDTSARVAPPSSEAQPPPTLRDLGDPLSVAIREAFRDGVVREARVMEVTGQPYRYDAQQVLDLSGQRVWLVTAVPERELYADAQRQALTGAATTGALTLVALLGALAVSSSLANHRRKRLRAERAARRAEEQVRQLGRYELLEPLGAGAMGEVYRARHTLLARDAALKLIKHREPSGEADTARDAERRQRFFDEAQRLASLHCLHTVAVHDFGVAEDGRYYLVMELLDGLDLATLVERDGPQPAARVAHILAQVCASLAEAHDAGLVHQDVKPANVFLCRIADALDFVKVLDFGLARAVGEQGAPGEAPIIEGTPAFMAPEQVVGEAITPAVDLYGLGGLGFFLLTGKPPYQGANRHALFAQHVHGPLPTWPEHSVEHTPAALRELLLSCLAKRPAERPPSARVLGEQLARLATELEGEFDPEARVRWWAAYGHRGRAPGGAPPESMSVRLDILRSVRRRLAGR
ncbi:MAG: serine/threonine-protein kinase, partial [Polyangiales bacterium]